MKLLTHHHGAWMLGNYFKDTGYNVIIDDLNFTIAEVERRHNRKVARELRSKYEKSVRHHQEHDDPAFPVVNGRGAPLLPSLASRDAPTVEPKRRFYRRAHDDESTIPTAYGHGVALLPSLASRPEPSLEQGTPDSIKAAESLRQQNRKSVRFAEGPRTYIKPTYVDGIPGHVLEVLDEEPHPSRETARGKGLAHLRRGKSTYRSGRYADQNGWYWQQVVDFEHSPDSTGKEIGVGGRTNDNEVSTDGPLDFLSSLGMFDKKSGQGMKERVRSLSIGSRTLSIGAPPGWTMINRRSSSQQQEGSARSGSIRGEKNATESREDSEETDHCDVFEDAQESITSSAILRRFSQRQKISAQSDLTFREDCAVEDDVDEQLEETGQQEVFEDAPERILSPALDGTESPFDNDDGQLGETAQDDVFEDAQEIISPLTHTRCSPHQLNDFGFAHFDPFGEDASLSGDDDIGDERAKQAEQTAQLVETDQCHTSETAPESLFPAHTRHFHQQQQQHTVDFARFDPFGEDDFFSDSDDEDENQQVEHHLGADQRETSENAQEGLFSAYTRRSTPQQQLSSARLDPFDVDGKTEETEETEETQQSDVRGNYKEGVSSSARLERSSVQGSKWMMPESEK